MDLIHARQASCLCSSNYGEDAIALSNLETFSSDSLFAMVSPLANFQIKDLIVENKRNYLAKNIITNICVPSKMFAKMLYLQDETTKHT